MIDVSTMMGSFTSLFLANPYLYITQAVVVLLATVELFILFYTLRDVLLRSHSFLYQFFCIVIVVLLPGVGFLLYLLIRPARTRKQREQEQLLLAIAHHLLPPEEEAPAEEEQKGEDEEAKPSGSPSKK